MCVWLALAAPACAVAEQSGPALLDAQYAAPTDRYPHGVLGDEIEHGALVLHYAAPRSSVTLTLPQERVFEDTAPRLADVDGDGRREAVVVESHQRLGARLAVYTGNGLMAATPWIGQRFRWLAPAGIGDLDGDGAVEIAYIDRPHLAKTLRIWRMENGALREVASLGGLTNHRIGESDIAGGLRNCGAQPELVLATRDWSRLVAVRLEGSTLTSRDIGAHTGRRSFDAALACD